MATAGKDLSAYDKNAFPEAEDFRIGLVVSEWNNEITESLCQGAINVLCDCGVDKENIRVWNVPGSFELIYGAKKMQQSFSPNAVISIGSVIQGETKHFDFVCHSVSQGIKDLNVQSDIPVIFCVLTDDTRQQALDRSGGKHGNKGAEAAVAALKMAVLRKKA